MLSQCYLIDFLEDLHQAVNEHPDIVELLLLERLLDELLKCHGILLLQLGFFGAQHGERFARPSLAIHEDRAVDAFEA